MLHDDDERAAWRALAKHCLARATGPDEPEYTLADILWSNAPLPLQFVEGVVCSKNEWALPQAEAVAYLRWCLENNIEILGYDIWAATTPGPTPLEPCGGEGNAAQCIEWIEAFDVEGERQKHAAPIVFNIWTRGRKQL